jgi:hypothetical protein
MPPRLILLSVLICLVASCDSRNPQTAVSVMPYMFVTSKHPLLTDLHGAYLLRLQLSPADHPETSQIADTCRAGGSVVVKIRDSSIEPFIVTTVTNEADALVVCLRRDHAIDILHALGFKDNEFQDTNISQPLAPANASEPRH